MEEKKNLFLSKGVWGALLVIAAPLANKFFGVNIDTMLQAEMSETISGWAVLLGATLALYGRIKATRKLTILS